MLLLRERELVGEQQQKLVWAWEEVGLWFGRRTRRGRGINSNHGSGDCGLDLAPLTGQAIVNSKPIAFGLTVEY
jgi:hypothetical protein